MVDLNYKEIEPINIATNKGGSPPTVNIGNDLLVINTNTNYVIITGSSRLAFSSGSLESNTKSAGTATLTGGNVLISGSNLNNAFIFLQRVSGSNANAGHLFTEPSSSTQFAVSSSEGADTGTFNYFFLGVTN
jgi:hypothetical protein